MKDRIVEEFIHLLRKERIKNGAFQRFKSKNRWFKTMTNDGYDYSKNYHDRLCLN